MPYAVTKAAGDIPWLHPEPELKQRRFAPHEVPRKHTRSESSRQCRPSWAVVDRLGKIDALSVCVSVIRAHLPEGPQIFP